MSLLNLVILFSVACVVLTLFNGIVSMAHGGEQDLHESLGLMFKRVGWQAFAFVALLFAMLTNLK